MQPDRAVTGRSATHRIATLRIAALRIAALRIATTAVICAMAGVASVRAQGPFMTPLADAASRSAHRFHLGAEYLGTVAWIDVDPINDLGRTIGIGNFGGPLYLHGFAGVFRFDGSLPKIMLSGGYHFGSMTRTATTFFSGVNVLRTATFTAQSAIGEVDYAALESSTFSFLPGLAVGHDWYGFEMRQAPDGGDSLLDVIDDRWLEIDPKVAPGRYARFDARAFLLQPMLNVEFRTYDAPMFKARLGIGYRFIPNKPEWRSESGVAVGDMPNIRAQGPVVQAGVALGLFLQ